MTDEQQLQIVLPRVLAHARKLSAERGLPLFIPDETDAADVLRRLTEFTVRAEAAVDRRVKRRQSRNQQESSNGNQRFPR